jgi:hypothetical protein
LPADHVDVVRETHHERVTVRPEGLEVHAGCELSATIGQPLVDLGDPEPGPTEVLGIRELPATPLVPVRLLVLLDPKKKAGK